MAFESDSLAPHEGVPVLQHLKCSFTPGQSKCPSMKDRKGSSVNDANLMNIEQEPEGLVQD